MTGFQCDYMTFDATEGIVSNEESISREEGEVQVGALPVSYLL